MIVRYDYIVLSGHNLLCCLTASTLLRIMIRGEFIHMIYFFYYNLVIYINYYCYESKG